MVGLVMFSVFALLATMSVFALKGQMAALEAEAVDFDGMELTQSFWSSK